MDFKENIKNYKLKLYDNFNKEYEVNENFEWNPMLKIIISLHKSI